MHHRLSKLTLVAVCVLLLGTEIAEAQAPPAPPKVNMRAIRKLKRQFEREPTVQQVQQASLRFFRVHPDKVSSYRNSAAWKALMPDMEVTFNLERGTNDRTLIDQLYPTFSDGREFEDTKRSGYTLGIRAHWSLDRLIFNAEVLDVTSLVGVQEGLLREITSLYFTRRRLMTIMALNPPQDPGEKITEGIRLGEIRANIDALTGGWFVKEIKRRLRGGERR
jgi:hypothetical protein